MDDALRAPGAAIHHEARVTLQGTRFPGEIDLQLTWSPSFGPLQGIIVEPANRGRSEVDELLVSSDSAFSGRRLLHALGFAVVTFGWQDDLCTCEGRSILGLRGLATNTNIGAVRFTLRVRNRGLVASLDEFGHLRDPSGLAFVVDRITGDAFSGRLMPRRPGHFSLVCERELLVGRPYGVEYETRSVPYRDPAAIFENVLENCANGDIEKLIGQKAKSRLIAFGISQSARFLNQTVPDLPPTWRQSLEAILFGSGGLGLAGEAGSPLGEVEAAPIVAQPINLGASLAIETSTDVWMGAPHLLKQPGTVLLAGVCHGPATAIRLPRPDFGEWFRPTSDTPIQAAPYVRALICKAIASGRGAFELPLAKAVESQAAIVHRFTARSPKLAEIRKVLALDRMGNEVGGVSPLELQVPVATHTGWAAMPLGDTHACFVPGFCYADRVSQRPTNKDPWGRPSLADLYRNRAEFKDRTVAATDALLSQNCLLDLDHRSLRATHLARWPRR